MKKFGQFLVPESVDLNESIRELQEDLCNNAECPFDIDTDNTEDQCKDCIYGYVNLREFKAFIKADLNTRP